MKRTSLMLDEQLLERATRALGARTYSATVNLALAQALENTKVQALWALAGSDAWEGNLEEMRRDQSPKRRRLRSAKTSKR